MYNFKFYEEAEKDLSKLNNNIKKLTQIIKNPEIGKDLGNKNNLNLAGLKKFMEKLVLDINNRNKI